MSGLRDRLPAPLRRIAGAVLKVLPESLVALVLPDELGFRPADVVRPVPAPTAPVRLYVAPVNFAGQGYRWARAARLLPGVGATSMQYRTATDFGFPADDSLPVAVFVHSRRWGRWQADRVLHGYTHVLVEAERPVLGRSYGLDLRREVAALRAAGVSVGLVSHGSDLRLPSRHLAREPWSPFGDPGWELARRLEEQALENARIVAELGAPVFVSTPDLLLDAPDATWLPVVVDPQAWGARRPVDLRARPVVVHAPSRGPMKGTAHVDAALSPLHEAGTIEYRQVTGVPADEMPGVYTAADIVVDQVVLGLYGVAAVEAMAAGRLVVGHVSEQVRAHVRRTTGLDVPVLEATPDTLAAVVEGVLARPEAHEILAARGPAFVAAVHDGRFSAEVLAPFLGVDVVATPDESARGDARQDDTGQDDGVHHHGGLPDETEEGAR